MIHTCQNHWPPTRIANNHEPEVEASSGQCIPTGAIVPSDHLSANTNKIVTRSSGSFAAITDVLGRSTPQLFDASPATKNITCECQLLSSSPRYCCFDIM